VVIRRALLIALVALAALPAAASAHAVLEETLPAQGAEVHSAPGQVEFRFSEPVEASFGAVRVFDSAGEEVQEGDLLRPDGDETVGVALPAGLPDGAYTATYRVVSADSHPVSGGFVFFIGDADQGSALAVGDLLDDQSAGPATNIAFWLDRAIGYAALGVGIGALAFALLVWGPLSARTRIAAAARDAFAARWVRIAACAVGAGIAASLQALPLQAATAAGTSFWDALDPSALGDVSDTRFGHAMLARVALWAMLGGALALGAARPGRRASTAVAALAAAGLAVTPALAGHASTQGPTAVLVPADTVHVAAMGLWLGGLVCLVAALPAATRRLEAHERGPLLLNVVGRFSAVALAAVLALAAAGVVQAIVELERVSDLWATGFGRLLVAKSALLAVLVGLGWHNRGRLIPALARRVDAGDPPGGPGFGLRRNLRTEVVLIAVVIGLSAVLVSYAPPGTGASDGPASGRVDMDGQVLEYTVDPAAVGRNQMHLYLFDAATGEQFDGAREVTATASKGDGIGPIPVRLRRAGPGHWVAPALLFGAGGEWTVEVTVRTSRFEQDTAEVEVEVG
jgi:copper transport protein